jgi:sodium-dependent dicarboxylate transporter 2/3/5
MRKVHLILPVVLAVVISFGFPNWLTWNERVVLSTVLVMLWWWISEAIPMAVTALVPILIFPLTNVMSMEKLVVPYADKFVFLFLGGFLLALAIEKHGLHKRIAFRLLDLAGNAKARILLAVMLSSYVLSMWISNTATAMMLIPIAASVAHLLAAHNYEAKFKRALVLGVAYAASIGGMATLIGTPPNVAAAGIVKEQFGEEISFVQWMKYGVPFSLILLLLVFLILSKIHFKRKETIDGAHAELHAIKQGMGKISKSEIRVLAVFAGAVLCWIFQAPISGFFHVPAFNDTWIALVFGLSLFFIPNHSTNPNERSVGLLEWSDTEKLSWGVLLMFGGGLALSLAFKEVGLLERLSQWLSVVNVGSSTTYLIMLCGIGLLLTALMSNLAMVTLFVPIVGVLAHQQGFSAAAWAIPVTLAASCDFMFPMSTPPNAIAYGTGWVKAKDMFTIGIIVNVISFFLLVGMVILMGH